MLKKKEKNSGGCEMTEEEKNAKEAREYLHDFIDS